MWRMAGPGAWDALRIAARTVRRVRHYARPRADASQHYHAANRGARARADSVATLDSHWRAAVGGRGHHAARTLRPWRARPSRRRGVARRAAGRSGFPGQIRSRGKRGRLLSARGEWQVGGVELAAEGT